LPAGNGARRVVTDERVRSGRLALTIAGSAIVYVACSVAAAAQARFDLLASDTVGGIKGLTAYTVRDNQTASCYTVFVLDAEKGAVSNAAMPSLSPPLNADQIRTVQMAQTLSELRAERDRQMMDLRGRTFTMWTIDYDMAREHIEQQYERAVGALLPDVYPSAQVAPDLRTTSRDALDAAVGRAIADGEAITAALAGSSAEQRVLTLLERIETARLSRLAVSSPVRCPPSAK
jgi:hypothetical protein